MGIETAVIIGVVISTAIAAASAAAQAKAASNAAKATQEPDGRSVGYKPVAMSAYG